MGKIDYEFKAQVLSEHSDIVRFQREWSLCNYLRDNDPDRVSEEEIETKSELVSCFFQDEYFTQVWREAEKINLAYYARVKRLKDRIRDMLCDGKCYFLTLTFNDETLAKTSAQTRRKYVTLFLKNASDTYCANIDFGSENGREHYHAVIKADTIDMTPWDAYGFSNAKKIASEDDCTPVAKYVSKLTNHAVKATTKGSRAIYSR